MDELVDLLAMLYASSQRVQDLLTRSSITIGTLDVEGSALDVWGRVLPILWRDKKLTGVINRVIRENSSHTEELAAARQQYQREMDASTSDEPGRAPWRGATPPAAREAGYQPLMFRAGIDDDHTKDAVTLQTAVREWWDSENRWEPLWVVTHFDEDASESLFLAEAILPNNAEVGFRALAIESAALGTEGWQADVALGRSTEFAHLVREESRKQRLVCTVPRWGLCSPTLRSTIRNARWCWQVVALFGGSANDTAWDGIPEWMELRQELSEFVAANSNGIRRRVREFFLINKASADKKGPVPRRLLASLARHLASRGLLEVALRIETRLRHDTAKLTLTREGTAYAIRAGKSERKASATIPDIADAPRSLQRWILSGETGHGKTTVLQAITKEWASPQRHSSGIWHPAWLPVFVTAQAKYGNLREALSGEFQRQASVVVGEGANSTIGLVAHQFLANLPHSFLPWVLSSPIYFIVDSAGADTRTIADWQQELHRDFSECGAVVACRSLEEHELLRSGASFWQGGALVHLRELTQDQYATLGIINGADEELARRTASWAFAIEPTRAVPAVRNPYLMKSLFQVDLLQSDGSLLLHNILDAVVRDCVSGQWNDDRVTEIIGTWLPELAMRKKQRASYESNPENAGLAANLGLVTLTSEDAEPQFTHNWLEDYFAARALRSLSESQRKDAIDGSRNGVGAKPLRRWLGVMQILTGWLSGSSREEFLDWLAGRDLELACQCLLQADPHDRGKLNAKHKITQALLDIIECRFRTRTESEEIDLETAITSAESLSFLDPRFESGTVSKNLIPVNNNFKLGKYPVTNIEFWRFCESGAYNNREYWDEGSYLRIYKGGDIRPLSWSHPEFSAANHPVTGVMFPEAEAYCRWLTSQEGKMFRLPHPAEWDLATDVATPALSHVLDRIIKAKKGSDWKQSETELTDLCKTVLAGLDDAIRQYKDQLDYSMGKNLGRKRASIPVGVFRPNRHGCHDLLGGVWEWCRSEDGIAMVKGGPVQDTAGVIWAALGGFFDPFVRFRNLGFRVCTETIGE